MMDKGAPCAQGKMITSLEDCKKCMGEGTDPLSMVVNLRSMWTGEGTMVSYIDGGQSYDSSSGGCHYAPGEVYLNTHPNPTGDPSVTGDEYVLCKSGEATPSPTPSPTPDASSGASIKIGSGSIKLGSGSIKFGNDL